MKLFFRMWVIFLFGLFGFAEGHQITFSHIDVRLKKNQTQVTVQLPMTALLQEQPSLLPVGTIRQNLLGNPLSVNVQAALKKLLLARLQLVANNKNLPLTINSVQANGEDIKLNVVAPSVCAELKVNANLFPTDTLHKIFVNVYRTDALVGQYALDKQNSAFTLAAPKRPLWETIITFIGEGIHHIYIGPDHILFVLALILLGGNFWSLIKILTAFTVAHSITLSLATLRIVELPSQLVESLIALSIVVVGLHDLRQLQHKENEQAEIVSKRLDLRVAFAFVFGLVHGFGFASVLMELQLPQNALAWTLAAFNIGVEVGQVIVLLLTGFILFLLKKFFPPRLYEGVLTAAAFVVVLVGGFWFWQRAFGA